jgi:hypothetical protein
VPILLADLRADLSLRCSGFLAALGLTPDSGPWDAYLDACLGQAMSDRGLPLASGLLPTDADLASLSAPAAYRLLDLAEYRAIATFRNRWTHVTTDVGDGMAKLSDLRDSADRRLEELGRLLGLDRRPLSAGSVRLSRERRFDEWGCV